VTEELSREYTTACEQLRTVGLSNSAPEKLARLLLEWSERGQTTESGTKFRFSLTHEEIGEFIGASRETVTRTLSIFKSRQLVAFHGSTLTIPNKVALENLRTLLGRDFGPFSDQIPSSFLAQGGTHKAFTVQ